LKSRLEEVPGGFYLDANNLTPLASNWGKKGIMTKTTQTALLLTTLSFGLASTLPAEQNRFYLNADVGGTHARDVELRDFFGQNIAANSTISLDPGIRVAVRAGYGLTDWLAAELETGISANNIDDITGATEANGSIANVPVLLNLRLHAPTHYRVSPYVGAGFGVASTVLDGDDIVLNTPPGTTRYSGTSADAVFAYQAFAGLRFAINDRMGLSLEYHFLHTEASSLSADLTVGPVTDRVRLGRTETHSVSVAFDFQF